MSKDERNKEWQACWMVKKKKWCLLSFESGVIEWRSYIPGMYRWNGDRMAMY